MKESEAKDELEFIKKVLEDSRRIIVDDGRNYIFWGIIAVTGLIATYLLILEKLYNNIKWVWIILIALGWIYTINYVIKKEKKKRVKTFAGKIISMIWFSGGLSMTIIGIAGSLSGAIQGIYISPTISVVLGMTYAITGAVYGDRWITSISAGWWIGGLIMYFYPGIHSVLMMASMMLLFQVIPGIVLYKRYKKELIVQQ